MDSGIEFPDILKSFLEKFISLMKGTFKDAQHFFFHCGNYQLHQTVLLDAVSQYQSPSLNLLLFGDKALSPDIDATIFEKVQAFILQSKRFQPY